MSSPVVQDAAVYACTVPSGSCEIAAELGDVDLPSLVLPEGRYYPSPE